MKIPSSVRLHPPLPLRPGQRRRSERGFSLIELLIVVSIIAVLAAMVMAASAAIQAKMVRNRTVAFLAEIQGGLDNYKIDHGTYPINAADNRDAAAMDGAHILYKYLSGDFDLDGKFDTDDPDNKIYVEGLDYKMSQKQAKGTVALNSGGQYVAIDPYGNLIRYLCDPPNRIVGGKVEIRTLNPTYDLWSLGGAVPDKEDLENKAKWITNWGTQ